MFFRTISSIAPVTSLHRMVSVGLLLILVGTHSSAQSGDLPEQQIQPHATERVVLLSNDELIDGVVTQDANQYFIAQKSGTVTVPRDKVAYVGNNPTEIYSFLARRISPVDVDANLELGQWCLNHRLLDCAELQLRQLKRIANGNDQVTRLEKRLQFLSELKNPARPAVGSAKLVATQPAQKARIDVPPAALAAYTRQVQPLLLNTCATAKCHDRVAPGSMKLYRPFAGTAFSKRLTERNLSAVLEHVNFVSPLQSRLLTVPDHPHGTANTAIFASSSPEQIRMLQVWVAQVTGKAIPVEVESTELPAQNDPLNPRPDPEFTNHKSTETPRPESTQPESINNDPFDPAEFNEG